MCGYKGGQGKTSRPEVRPVAVLDFGGQYAHLIARRVRELGFYSEILPHDVDLSSLKALSPQAVILSGGPRSVYEEDAPDLKPGVLEWIVERKVPALCICYGHQLVGDRLGGRVERGAKGEYGTATLTILRHDPLFEGTPRVQKVWMSHMDQLVEPPPGAVVLARTEITSIAAFRLSELPLYGVQFHPEVRHTEHGLAILKNFLEKAAGATPNWRPESLAERKVAEVKAVYRGGNVLVAASGGVDSTVAAYLTMLAIGSDKLHLVVIDTGLLREGEADEVVRTLRGLGFKHVHLVKASREFLEALKGVTDPEEKRRRVAAKYFEVLERAARELEAKYGKFKYLVQGTIYPDRIESGRAGRGSDRIKSHHNVTLPEKLGLELIEPLADLYKDEVRRLARALGLPPEVVTRHPFPGPGLAVRIVGEVTEEGLKILRRATKIVEDEVRRAGLYERLWQAFPALLPVKTTGVKGDARSYEYAVALRFVVSEDAMTAEFAKVPWELLERIATRITNEVKGVNRVLYDITNKPPATIEYE